MHNVVTCCQHVAGASRRVHTLSHERVFDDAVVFDTIVVAAIALTLPEATYAEVVDHLVLYRVVRLSHGGSD